MTITITPPSESQPWSVVTGLEEYGITEMFISDPEIPYTLSCIFNHVEYGIQGCSVFRSKDVSLEDCLSFIAENASSGDYEGKVVRDDIHFTEISLNEILLGAVAEEKTGPDGSPMAGAYSVMLRKNMTDQAFNLLLNLPVGMVVHGQGARNELTTRVKNLSLISGGDSDARVAVLRAYPGLFEVFQDGGECLNAVDLRNDPFRPLAEIYEISSEEMRVFRDMNAVSSRALRKDLSPLAKKIICNTGFMLAASKMLTSGQIPDNAEDMARAIDLSNSFTRKCRSVGLGSEFAKKTIRRVNLEERNQTELISEFTVNYSHPLTDFLTQTANALSSAVIMNAFQNSGLFDFDVLSEAASDLFSGRDVDTSSADAMREFLDCFEEVEAILNITKYYGNAKSDIPEPLKSSVIDLMGQSSSLKRLNERSERWHHTQAGIQGKVLDIDGSVEWKPLIGRLAVGDEQPGVYVRELHSSCDLKRQGDHEDHCVGSYASIILEGNAYKSKALFSIENEADVLSTVEIEITPDYSGGGGGNGYSFRNVQHMAASNRSPCEEAVRASEALVNGLHGLPRDEVKAYISGIQSNTHDLAGRAAKALQKAGLNIYSADAGSNAMEAYRDVLPKKMRDLKIEDLTECLLEVRPDLVEVLNHAFEELEQKRSDVNKGVDHEYH